MRKILQPARTKLSLTLIIIVLIFGYYYSSDLFNRPCNALASRPNYQQNYIPTNLPGSQNSIKNPDYEIKDISINQDNLPRPRGSSGYEPSILYTFLDIDNYIKPFENAISPCPFPYFSIDESASFDSVIPFMDALKDVVRFGIIFLYITAFYLISCVLMMFYDKLQTKKIRKKKS